MPSEHIEWAYYYLYNGPSKVAIEQAKGKIFDSALLPGEGVTEEDEHPAENPRQAYCVLALNDKEGCSVEVITKAAISSTITSSEGTVSLDVNPQGQTATYFLEYGTTSEYGYTTSATSVANENGTQSETVALSGLEPCTTYHYQAEAENEANKGTPSLGGDETFTTGCPPTVITGNAHELPPYLCGEGAYVELTGQINPNGLPTTYYFEYKEYNTYPPAGTELLGEGRTATESAGSGTELDEVGGEIHLKDPPIACYNIEFRLVGANSAGTSYGELNN
jgi:hypothetical protein